MSHSRKTAAEISRLVNKFPGLGEDVFVHEHDFNQVANSLAAVKAENAALAQFKQDAKRYRWLRDRNSLCNITITDQYDRVQYVWGTPQLNKAIDSARKGDSRGTE